MDKRERSQISGILLTVGVVFILIAGGIFVKTTWQYLPESGKKLLLFFVTMGLFAGERKLSMIPKLAKASTAFYYLGTGFAGFLVISLLGGMERNLLEMIWLSNTLEAAEYNKLLMAHSIMLVLIILRFRERRDPLSFGTAILLMDSGIFWFSVANLSDVTQFALLQAGILAAVAVFDYQACRDGFWERKFFVPANEQGSDASEEDRNGHNRNGHKIEQIFLASYVLRASFATWGYVLGVLCQGFDRREVMIYLPLITIAASFALLSRKKTLYRVIQSTLLFQTIYTFVGEILQLTYQPGHPISYIFWEIPNPKHGLHVEDQKGWISLLDAWGLGQMSIAQWLGICLVFFIGLGLFLQLRRREMKVMLLFLGEILLEFLWPAIEMLDIPGLSELYGEWHVGMYVLGIVVFCRIWYDKWEGIRLVQFVLIWQALAVLLLFDLCGGELINVLVLGLTALAILVVAAVRNHKEYVIGSATLLLFIAVYLTRGFWMSIAWWVYLFVAGVILIGLALKKLS